MQVAAKDKRIKALNRGERNVAGLQPNEENLILNIITVLQAAPNLALVSTAHPAWRVHHYKPRKASSPWSIDVLGNTRLMFEYDTKTHRISGLRYEDPHRSK